MSLPCLTSLTDEAAMDQFFFSDTANWVIPGIILVGESPASACSMKARMETLRIKGNVTTFVCLQSEVLPQSEDSVIFGGYQDGCKKDILPSYAKAAYQTIDEKVNSKIKFVYYGIRDMQRAKSLEELDTLINDLLKRVEDGEVLYIHCMGGKGRAGLVSACILGCLYPNLSLDEVLERIYSYCTMRWKGQGKCVPHCIKSPETKEQCQQVMDYLMLRRGKETHAKK
jgi:hypothetical protein